MVSVKPGACLVGIQEVSDELADNPIRQYWVHIQGFPVGAVIKNPPANAGDAEDTGSIPVVGRSPENRHGNPLQSSCLVNPMDKEPGGLWSMGPQRTRCDWATKHTHSVPSTLQALYKHSTWMSASLLTTVFWGGYSDECSLQRCASSGYRQSLLKESQQVNKGLGFEPRVS